MNNSNGKKSGNTSPLVYVALGVGVVVGVVMKNIAFGLIVGFIGAALANYIEERRK